MAWTQVAPWDVVKTLTYYTFRTVLESAFVITIVYITKKLWLV